MARAEEGTPSNSTFEGYRKLVDLKRKMIMDWLDTLEIGSNTLSNIQSCPRSAMTEAIDEELIENNPLAGWTYKRKAAPTDDDDVAPSVRKSSTQSWLP